MLPAVFTHILSIYTQRSTTISPATSTEAQVEGDDALKAPFGVTEATATLPFEAAGFVEVLGGMVLTRVTTSAVEVITTGVGATFAEVGVGVEVGTATKVSGVASEETSEVVVVGTDVS